MPNNPVPFIRPTSNTYANMKYERLQQPWQGNTEFQSSKSFWAVRKVIGRGCVYSGLPLDSLAAFDRRPLEFCSSILI